MAFWLARERRGQHCCYIQRFDPRFWTVNFPRPMMASVVSTAADALRVDCSFYHKGELAGLIWESEDRLDHPLLAYETQRNYAHCILKFRWRSGGVIVLDQPHGPTLTIEGRDAAGNARAWYVRLWNYASGTPNDALIELPFSALQSGYGLPGEPVHPSDIDRMFISLVPQGYVEGSTEQLPARVDGWAEMSGISCEGAHASLETGDVLLPAHGEQIATAYDDSFNQTPARLLRNIEGLGYRGRIVHYVGMSHYFRLEPLGDAHYISLAGGVLNGPCEAWHRAYADRARELDFELIWSLSYELFDAHCWNDWKQRAPDGSAALTGWVPPSTLLSPAHAGAMAYLQQVARAFVAIARDAGLWVLFQIGEPWWWTVPESGAPCIYDASARQALGGDPVAIPTLRAPLDAGQRALLDAAGDILSDSTDALAEAVRDAASGDAEVLLLTFTPTVLDPATPDAWRANMPVGWRYPAFDRLQLEDYDWLTGGADAARRRADGFVADHLGYPVAATDYFSGFVLLPENSEEYWPLIDRALDAARDRGVTQRFVWALPQVARDGYTRLPSGEQTMIAFDDVAYPLELGRDAAASPEFSTSVAVTASGHEHRNALWSDARMRYDVGPGIRSESELGTLLAFFRARYGPARGFRLRDPFDFSSNRMTGEPTPLDQPLGTGDGSTSRFRLAKTYGDQKRPITRPVPSSLQVALDGSEIADWQFETGGWIVFKTAPATGVEITAGFLFDVPVRFAEDRLDVSGLAFAAGEAPSVPLVEIREPA